MRTDLNLAPEVQAVIVDTIADWRRRKGQCPDPEGHERLMSQREQTWREPVQVGAGFCSWCGFRVGGA